MSRQTLISTKQEGAFSLTQAREAQSVQPFLTYYKFQRHHEGLYANAVQDWLKFQCLVARWHTERGAMSSITEAASCPAYQSIIGMGLDAVPLILLQLKSEGDEPDQWFWALKAILQIDPVEDQDRGNFVRMARAWLEWGQTEGYDG